ncbi:MAG: hypothetical protein QW350_05755 [Candidatus Aenigmatarchaeota archaeon]
MIVKNEKGEYEVRSKDGKKLLGKYKTKKEAEERLRQVEYFKRKRKSKSDSPS